MDKNSKSTTNIKKKKEFSKIICSVAALCLFITGLWIIIRYYQLIELGIDSNSVVQPDAALPIAGITSIIAPIISYLLYQWGLKSSRNKYRINADGEPMMTDQYDMPINNNQTSTVDQETTDASTIIDSNSDNAVG